MSNTSRTLVKDVPSRARNSKDILDYASEHGITNEMLIKVGLRMNAGLIFGSNHRSVAMLIVYKSIIDETESHNHLQTTLNTALNFLNFCRPLSISMTNVHKFVSQEILDFKQQSAQNETTPFDEQQNNQLFKSQMNQLKHFIDSFINEEIWSAQKGICENISSNIRPKDVILVFGCSTIVQHVLLHAKSKNTNFRIIVVDSAPHFNGRRMLNFLNDNYIDVTYTVITSLSYVMRQATKVLLGANSILANGYVMSHIGTSQVALMAKASNVPTLVCCETYKLSDKVYVDSFVCNETDDRKDLTSALNLRYDLTPPEFVSMVINEKSTVPAISVPALLRFRAERSKRWLVG